MDDIENCWARASQCALRAEEATDRDVGEFFRRLRDAWIRAANHQQISKDFETALPVVEATAAVAPR
jgi:hypothetical protein